MRQQSWLQTGQTGYKSHIIYSMMLTVIKRDKGNGPMQLLYESPPHLNIYLN